MKLVYMTLRRNQIPNHFRTLIYPAVLQWMELPSNHKPIQKSSLLEVLQHAKKHAKQAWVEVVVFTAGRGNHKKIVESLMELPRNFTIYLAALDETGLHNIRRLKHLVSKKYPEAVIKDIWFMRANIIELSANDIVDMLKGGYSRN